MSKGINQDEWAILLDAMIHGDASGAIVRAEQRGQQALNASDVLPRECNVKDEDLTALGFVLGDPVDDLFRRAQLPPGWTKRPTDHQMHTDLLDEKGRRRGGIFYKAAPYDRRADMSFTCRFTSYEVPVLGWGVSDESDYVARVFDNGTVIWESAPRKRNDREGRQVAVREAGEWLVEHYPDYRSRTAYWD